MRTLTLALLCAAALTGCDERSAQSAKAGFAATKQAGQQAARATQDAANTGLEAGKQLTRTSIAGARQMGQSILDQHGGDINAAGAQINALLAGIARDPSVELTPRQRATRMVVLMLPLIRSTQRFADARALFAAGAGSGSDAPEQLARARRTCLIAFAEAGLDIATLGMLGGNLDAIATEAARVLTAVKLSGTIADLTGADLKILDQLLDALLEIEAVRVALDRALDLDFSRLVSTAKK